MINAINMICKTAGCPTFGDWAIKKGITKKWSQAKRGDIVLFDFNHNGTSDHIGIVTKVGSGYIETIEGNTGNGSNTNGDGVYKRTRYKSNVNYFVRPAYNDKVTAEMIIATALAEVGYREGRNNNNKYGRWFGQNYVSWCCIFICWVFAHVQNLGNVYKGELPTKLLKKGAKGDQVKRLQNFLNWYGNYGLRTGEFGAKTEAAVKDYQKKEGLVIDGEFGPKSLAKAKVIMR